MLDPPKSSGLLLPKVLHHKLLNGESLSFYVLHDNYDDDGEYDDPPQFSCLILASAFALGLGFGLGRPN